MSVGAYDRGCLTKRVYFRPTSTTDTVRVGDGVCYNSDLAADYKARTAAPHGSHLGGSGATAYNEGVQSYTARLFVVEKPKSANLSHFAGIVKALGPEAGGDGDFIEIWVLTAGMIIPVYTDADCVVNETPLGIDDGAYTLSAVTNAEEPLIVGVAVETVDRSTDNGLVWMRMVAQPGISRESAYFKPSRYDALLPKRRYGIWIDGDDFFTGTVDSQCYLLQITGSKATISSGDTYGGLLFIKGWNESVNTSNYIWRGINCSVHNEGTLSWLENVISVNNESGSTAARVFALCVNAENYGTVSGIFGALDIDCGNSSANVGSCIAMRINNTDESGSTQVTAIYFESHASSSGFAYLFDFDNLSVNGNFVLEDNLAAPTKAGSIKIKTPAGADAWINYYDGSRA